MTAIISSTQIAANAILGITTNINNSLTQQYKDLYNNIWNPATGRGVTTAGLIAALGADAAAVLAGLAAIPAVITAFGGTVPTVTGAVAYTPQTDGTVTLN